MEKHTAKSSIKLECPRLGRPFKSDDEEKKHFDFYWHTKYGSCVSREVLWRANTIELFFLEYR